MEGIMRLVLSLMLLSFPLFATTWNDLEMSSQYKINQAFQLPQLERSHSLLDINVGDLVVLKEVVGLDMINVALYRFEYKNCPGTSMKTEMEIIPVKNTAPVVEVGAQLELECMLEIFIENKDTLTESFFE
jgi:hypothetical protein